MTLPDAVGQLVSARRLERVPADAQNARVRLARADDKLRAARKIAKIDVEVAYVTAYERSPHRRHRAHGVARPSRPWRGRSARGRRRLRRSDARHPERVRVPAHASATEQVRVRRRG